MEQQSMTNAWQRLHNNESVIIPVIIWGALIALGLTYNLRSPFPSFYFFSDEATYYTMTLSLVHDHDLEYSKKDLERVYREWEGGPTGIFLKKSRTGMLTYGKAYIYPLFAALLVKWFGLNGFLLLNTICFCILVTVSACFISQWCTPRLAYLFSLFYFLFSSTWIFMFWIHPELLLMALVMGGLYTGLQPGMRASSKRKRYTYLFLSAMLLAMASFGKVTNAVFAPVIAAGLLFLRHGSGNQNNTRSFHFQRLLLSVVYLLIFAIVLWLLFTINAAATGDFNYQWGERKGFARVFPLSSPDHTFESLGSPATRRALEVHFEPSLLMKNAYYFLFGRFAGLLPYFFPFLVVMVLVVRGGLRKTNVFLLGALVIQQLFYFIFLTANYIGGMGTIGNRYFLNAFPAGVLLLSRKVPIWSIVIIALAGSLFLGPMMVNPLAHSYQPAEHTFAFPYKLLPVEVTQIDFIPVHINHHLSRRYYDKAIPYRLTFMDYQSYLPEEGGYWVRPGKASEVLLETKSVSRMMKVTVRNGPMANRVKLHIDGFKSTLQLNPWKQKEVKIPLHTLYEHNKWRVHSISIKVKKGFIPSFHDKKSDDLRYLGAFITIELLDPLKTTGE